MKQTKPRQSKVQQSVEREAHRSNLESIKQLQSQNNDHTVLFRCKHHIYPNKYTCDVILLRTSVEIICYSKADKKSWRQKISLCLVSSFIQRYYYSLNTLWDLLAHSIVFIGSEMKFSTQHIVNYHIRKTSHHNEAYIIWQRMKEISAEETWSVEFLSECNCPFTLELCIKKAPNDLHRYACRVEMMQISDLFDEHCLAPYRHQSSRRSSFSTPQKDVVDEDYPMEPNYLLQALLDDLFFDEDTDSFMVKFVELSSLENYLEVSEKNVFVVAPQKTLPVMNMHDEDGSDGESLSSQPSPPHTDTDHQLSEPQFNREQQQRYEDHHSAAANEELPNLIEQISRRTEFHRRPPAIDRLRTDTELEDLATSIILELDSSNRHTAQKQEDVLSAVEERRLGSLQETIQSGSGAAVPVHVSKAVPLDASPDTRKTFVSSTAANSVTSRLEELRLKYARPPEILVENESDDDQSSSDSEAHSPLNLNLENPRSLYGFDNSDGEGEKSTSDVPSLTLRSPSTMTSEKTSMRGDFLKKFNQSKFYRATTDPAALARNKIDELVNLNTEMVKRTMADITQKLVDPAKALKGAGRRPVGSEFVNFSLVQDALSMKPSYRSWVTCSLIIDMLKNGCRLSRFLNFCSEDDLLSLCQACILQDIPPKEKGSEALHLRHEAVLSLYIIMHGQLNITTYEQEVVGFDGPLEEIVRQRRVSEGDCVGECVLSGVDSWAEDVATIPAQPVSLCNIPLEAAQRYIGKKSDESEGVMVLFWKHHRLWQEIKHHNQDLLLHAKYRQEILFPKTRENLHFDFSPMNVIDSCRIRVFQPGTEVFTQGRPRHFLYVMLRGCCEYRRTFPNNVVGASLMPDYKELGVSLMCGDFSFMDGEDHLWLEGLEEQDDVVKGSDADSQRIREHRLRKYSRFGTHKNTLFAATRVEMAVVPIVEIAKCIKLFTKLIRRATELYPLTFIPSEELVRQHYEAEKWKVDRKDVIREIAVEREARVLRESYFQSTNNNVSDHLYKSQQPGSKLIQSTLHSIIQHFADPKELMGGATDIPPEHIAKAFSPHKTPPKAKKVLEVFSYESESNKMINEMNRPRRELMDNYFNQFNASRKGSTDLSSSKSRKCSTKIDPPKHGKVDIANSLTSTNTSSPPKSPRPPLWQPRPSSAGSLPSRRATTTSSLPVPSREQPSQLCGVQCSAPTSFPSFSIYSSPIRPSSAQKNRPAHSAPVRPHSAIHSTAARSTSIRTDAMDPASFPRPHSTGSSRHLQNNQIGNVEKKVAFANFEEFAVNDELAAELNSFCSVDSPTLVETADGVVVSPAAQRPNYRYKRIKESTRKQNNRPVPIVPEQFVQAYKEIVAEDPRQKFIEEFITRVYL